MLLDDVATYLAGAGLGLSMGSTGNLWKGIIPEAVTSTTVALQESPGSPPLRAMGASLGSPVAEQPRFKVIVYGPNDQISTARTLAESIYLKLDGLLGQTLGTTFYLIIRALQPPFPLPPDDRNNYWTWHINLEALKARG